MTHDSRQPVSVLLLLFLAAFVNFAKVCKLQKQKINKDVCFEFRLKNISDNITEISSLPSSGSLLSWRKTPTYPPVVVVCSSSLSSTQKFVLFSSVSTPIQSEMSEL